MQNDEAIRVLLVDDHALFRQVLRGVMESDSSYRVVAEATNGLEALEAARNLSPDVVVMDVSMPEMDGIEAARIMGQEMPEVRLVLVSATHVGRRASGEGSTSSVPFILDKARIPGELLEVIRQVRALP